MTVQFKDQDIERRLSLYQVFVSLYERHSHLLNQILELDNLSELSCNGTKAGYVQGVIDESGIYVITNLCDNQTQTLQQPQHIWTIGRDRNNGIYTKDQLLSRRHAAIQYLDNEGFFLIDCNSKNGSFVNGEPAYQPVHLKDGDRIRLGSLAFDFFLNHHRRILPLVATDLLKQAIAPQQQNLAENQDQTIEISLDPSYLKNLKYGVHGLSTQQKSEILDGFWEQKSTIDPF